MPKFKDQAECCEAIARELSLIIKEPWTHVDVLAKRFESSINLSILFVRPDGSRESDVEPIMLDEYLFDLAFLVSTTEKGLYKECRFHLASNGKYEVTFGY